MTSLANHPTHNPFFLCEFIKALNIQFFPFSISFIVHANRNGEPRIQVRLLTNLETTRFKLIFEREREKESFESSLFTFRWPFDEIFIIPLEQSFMKTDIVARKYRTFYVWLYPSSGEMKNSRSVKSFEIYFVFSRKKNPAK